MNIRPSHLNMRRSNPICALSLCAILLSLLLFAGAHQARATETEWQTYVSPAHAGYILTASYPPEWKINEFLPTQVRFIMAGLPTTIPGITAEAEFNIQWADLHWEHISSFIPRPFAARTDINDVPPKILEALKSGTATSDQLDRIIPIERCGRFDERGCVDFKRTSIHISDNDGILIEFAEKKVFDADEKTMVDPTHPTKLAAYFTPYSGNIALRIAFTLALETTPEGWGHYTNRYRNTALVPIYEELLPTVMRFLESVKFQPLSDFDKNVVFNVLYKNSIHIAQRYDYEATGSFKITHPSDWEVQKLEATPPIARVGEGRLVVSFTGPDDLSSTGEPEYLIVDLRGMSNPPYEPADFLATTDPIVQTLMQNPQKISAESAEIEGFRRFASMRSTYITGTKQTYINTYVGKSEDGARLKIRTYTAGGQSMAANIIFVADEEDFDGTLPVIEKMIDSLSVSLFEPASFQ